MWENHSQKKKTMLPALLPPRKMRYATVPAGVAFQFGIKGFPEKPLPRPRRPTKKHTRKVAKSLALPGRVMDSERDVSKWGNLAKKKSWETGHVGNHWSFTVLSRLETHFCGSSQVIIQSKKWDLLIYIHDPSQSLPCRINRLLDKFWTRNRP